MCTMSANVKSAAQGGRYVGRWKGLLELLVMSFEVSVESGGQLQEHRASGREFQILRDATEKLWAPNAVCANGTASRLLLEYPREPAGLMNLRSIIVLIVGHSAVLCRQTSCRSYNADSAAVSAV